MKTSIIRLFGKGLVLIGGPISVYFSYGTFIVLTYTGEYGPFPYNIVLVPIVAFVGGCMTGLGIMILRGYEERKPFFTREGELIHSGEPWKKRSESGLFATSCGLAVSINQESKETAHVGYRIVYVDQATCKACVVRAGREVIEHFALHRSY